MKLTNEQIVNSIQPLRNLLNKQIKIKAAFKLATIVKTIDVVATEYEKFRTQLINKYAVKGEDGNPAVKDGNVEITDAAGFSKEVQELLSVETDVNVETINISSLGDVDMSVSELLPLSWLFAE